MLINSKKHQTNFRRLSILLGLTFLFFGIVSISFLAQANQMNIPTFLYSIGTRKVTVKDLQAGKWQSVIFIDVRSPEEYAEDRIESSILIPLTDIELKTGVNQIVKIAKDYKKKHQVEPMIVLYCHSGLRSIKAYRLLENTGLNIAFLAGGITAWREFFPLEKETELLVH